MQADNPQTGGADSPRNAAGTRSEADSQPDDTARPPIGGASRVGEREERVGPLLLDRYVKDDRRTLLLYRHADGEASGT